MCGASGNVEKKEEKEEKEDQWRTSRFDPLWEGLGSLGERLALMDGSFDELNRDISHDRDVSKFQHCYSQHITHYIVEQFRKRYSMSDGRVTGETQYGQNVLYAGLFR